MKKHDDDVDRREYTDTDTDKYCPLPKTFTLLELPVIVNKGTDGFQFVFHLIFYPQSFELMSSCFKFYKEY